MRDAPAEHFVVVLAGETWAVPVDRARECHPVPMLDAPPAGCADDVVGIATLRGERIPVVRPPARARDAPPRIEDAILVLHATQGPVALLADAVLGIRRLRGGRSFLLDQAPLPVLDVDALWRATPDAPSRGPAWRPATAELAVVLESRARVLAAAPALGGARPVVTVEIGGAIYAVPLERVRAFVEADDVAPIPRAPAHVRGDVNVRGEIVTLFDVRAALGLADAHAQSKAIVVGSADRVAGFLVDRIGEIAESAARGVPFLDVDGLLLGTALGAPEGSA